MWSGVDGNQPRRKQREPGGEKVNAALLGSVLLLTSKIPHAANVYPPVNPSDLANFKDLSPARSIKNKLVIDMVGLGVRNR